MAENPSGTESLLLQIQQLEHERDELRKDIEQLCIQQAGPSYLVVATKMHFQRTAALEQEIESLKKKLATCTRENINLQEELSEAYRIKGQLADLHQAEVIKNQEAEKQLKFFQSCVAGAFAERDNSIMEAEKAKEKEDTMHTKLRDVQERMEELLSQCLEQRNLIDRLQTDLASQEENNVTFKKVVDMFYEIRQQPFENSEGRTWDQKCSCLLNDPPGTWSYNDPSTSKYISAVEEELQSVRNTVDVLQNKLRVGMEIENHLKKKVRDLEKKKLVSDKMLRSGVSGLRQHHSLHRLQIMDVLEEERCYINSVISMVDCKITQITETREMRVQSSSRLVEEPDNNNSSDEVESKIINDCSKDSAECDASKALAQALQEKVSVLLLLSQQEERHLLDRNVNAALQKKIEELQRNLLQVTNEKVKALMEMAKLRQDYQLLQEKMDPEARQGKDIVPICGNRLHTQEQDGKLRNILKKTYLNRWIGNTIDFGRSAVESRFTSERSISGGKSNNGMEFARVMIENATLKESLESMEHLTSSIHRLRISLTQVKDSCMGDESVTEIMSEALMVKTALSSCLPVSWSAEEDMESESILHSEKVDFVSAAGFEMVELLILAAQVLKEKYNH